MKPRLHRRSSILRIAASLGALPARRHVPKHPTREAGFVDALLFDTRLRATLTLAVREPLALPRFYSCVPSRLRLRSLRLASAIVRLCALASRSLHLSTGV
jgi:hypothetical protein